MSEEGEKAVRSQSESSSSSESSSQTSESKSRSPSHAGSTPAEAVEEAKSEEIEVPRIKQEITYQYTRSELNVLNTEECTKFPSDLDLVTVPWFRDFDKRVTASEPSADEQIALKPQWGRAAGGAGRGLPFGLRPAAPGALAPGAIVAKGPIHSRLVDNGTMAEPIDTSRRPDDGRGRGDAKAAWRADGYGRGDVDDRGKPIERVGSMESGSILREATKPRWGERERPGERNLAQAPEPPPRGENKDRADNWRNPGGPAAAPRARWDDNMAARRKPSDAADALPALAPTGPDPWADDAKVRPAGAARRMQMTAQDMERERLEFRAAAIAEKNAKGNHAYVSLDPSAMQEANLDDYMDEEQRACKLGREPPQQNGPPSGIPAPVGGMKLTFNQLAGAAKPPEAAPPPVKAIRLEDLERGMSAPEPSQAPHNGQGNVSARGPPPGIFGPPATNTAPRPAAPPGFQAPEPPKANPGQALLGLLTHAKTPAPDPAPIAPAPVPALAPAPAAPQAPAPAPIAKPALPSLFATPGFGTAGVAGDAVPADVRNAWGAPSPAVVPTIPADIKKAWDDVPSAMPQPSARPTATAAAQPQPSGGFFGNAPQPNRAPNDASGGQAGLGGANLLAMLQQKPKPAVPQMPASLAQENGLLAMLGQRQQQQQQQQQQQHIQQQQQMQQQQAGSNAHLLQLLQQGAHRAAAQQQQQQQGTTQRFDLPAQQAALNDALLAMQQRGQQQAPQQGLPPGFARPQAQPQQQQQANFPGLYQNNNNATNRQDAALAAMLSAANLGGMMQQQPQQQQQQNAALQEQAMLQRLVAQAQQQQQQQQQQNALRPNMPPPPPVLAGMPPPPRMHMGFNPLTAMQGFGGAQQAQRPTAQAAPNTDMARVLASLQGMQGMQQGMQGLQQQQVLQQAAAAQGTGNPLMYSELERLLARR